jgi:hypothetical protein
MDAVKRTRELSIRVDIRVAETTEYSSSATESKENEYRLVYWSNGEDLIRKMQAEFEVVRFH